MKKSISLIFLFFSFKIFAQNPLVLIKGQSHQLKTHARRVWVSNGKILQAKSAAQGVLLYAKALGEVTLALDGQNQKVFVTTEGDGQAYAQIETALNHIHGLTLEFTNSGLSLQGQLVIWEDWLYISNIVKTHNARLQMQAQLSDELLQVAHRHINTLLRAEGLAPITLQKEALPNVVVSSQNEKFRDRYQNVLSTFGLKILLSSGKLSPAPLVRLKILFAEVSKGFSRNFGIEWPSQLTASLVPKFKAPTDWGVSLNLIEDDAYGRVLATPTLLCRSGAEAEFLAGGEFPVRVGGKRTQDVQWKKHGVLLKFKPIADHTGALSISLTTEFSLPDYSAAVDGVPSLKTNRVQSEFDLKESQTILLSGLVKESMGQSKQGLPYLAQIPVLGEIISSHNFMSGKSEMIVLVRPALVSPNGE